MPESLLISLILVVVFTVAFYAVYSFVLGCLSKTASLILKPCLLILSVLCAVLALFAISVSNPNTSLHQKTFAVFEAIENYTKNHSEELGKTLNSTMARIMEVQLMSAKQANGIACFAACSVAGYVGIAPPSVCPSCDQWTSYFKTKFRADLAEYVSFVRYLPIVGEWCDASPGRCDRKK